MVRAAIEFERLNMPHSLWKWDTTIRTSTARRGGPADRLSEPAVRPLALNSN